MIVRGRDFSDIYDLVGVRILVDSVRDCYAVLGTVHATWNPVPGRFKDYIAMPKFNMYQSLHTTVIGPEGKPSRCRSAPTTMHRAAEYGIAAHWRYKEAEVGGKLGPDDLGWLRQLAGVAAGDRGPRRVPGVAALRPRARPRCSSSRPRATSSRCPSGSTPVDFAYAVHTEVGHRCVGARVNGRLVPLDSHAVQRRRRRGVHLQGRERRPEPGLADVRPEPAGPQQDQGLVLQGAARGGDRDRARTSCSGDAQGGRLPLQRLLSTAALVAVAADLRQPDITALYAAIGEGQISPRRSSSGSSRRRAARPARSRTLPRR